MNCELFSIRGDQEEVNRLNENLGTIVNQLAKLDIKILFKTEIDRSTSKIEEAILESVNDQPSPEIIIMANVLDEFCGADFNSVFSKILSNWENRYRNSLPVQDRNKEFHVKVFTIDNLGCGHDGYCFTIHNTRIIALPSESLTQKNIADLIFDGVTCALNKFRGSNLLFPNGFDFSSGDKNSYPPDSKEGNGEKPGQEDNDIYSSSSAGSGGQVNSEENKDIYSNSSDSQPQGGQNNHAPAYAHLSAKDEKKLKKAMKKEAKRKGKKSFFQRNFPCRGDRPSEAIRKSIVLVSLVTIIVCVAMIVNEVVILPAQNEKRQNNIQNIFYNRVTQSATTEENESTGETQEEQPTEETVTYNWDALKEINSEIIGWISIDNTVIDYPVLCHPDDPPGTTSPYYLSHNYAGQWDSYGSIFTDPTSYAGLDTQNIVLHGHHMNDGSMFGNLANYGTGFVDGYGTPYVNLDFYKSAPIIHFNTPEWNAEWKIIAVIHTNALESHGTFFNYLQGNFGSDEEFLDFVYDIRERSIIDTDVTVNENDQLLTLSTCTYEFENFRTAVIARRVRPGEDSTVNVDNASVNSDMVWPDVYYWTYGGSKPEDKSFAQAYADGEISWYDGELFSTES